MGGKEAKSKKQKKMRNMQGMGDSQMIRDAEYIGNNEDGYEMENSTFNID